MATPLDASFGAGFNADKFRAAIRSTMMMGLPNSVSERATFRWLPVREYPIQDRAANPYDWTDTPSVETLRADVLVPVAVEFAARPSGSQDTVIGQFDSSRAIVTILDVDYALVEGADQVILGGNTYIVQFVAPPVGLFDVTVYTIYLEAVDET